MQSDCMQSLCCLPAELVTNASKSMHPKLANIQNSAAIQWLEICHSLEGAVTTSLGAHLRWL